MKLIIDVQLCDLRKRISYRRPKRYFCYACYKQWESDILAKSDWIRFCINYEHQQRRQALKDNELIYLGDEFGMGDFNGEYRLVSTKEYFDEQD